jgi:hypothetical protein
MTVCFSFRDDCWRVYLLWDFIWCATYRRVGPSFSSKDQANAFVAAVRRGDASLAAASGTSHE